MTPRHDRTCASCIRNARAATARRAACGGFTLLETALATVIIGVGILALVEAHESFSKTNDFATQAATANYLANEIRERIRVFPRHDPVTGLFFQVQNGSAVLMGWGREANEVIPSDFNDIDDFDGLTFGVGGDFPGPIDSTCAVLPEIGPDGNVVVDQGGAPLSMRGWSQVVHVDKVDPQNVSQVRAHNYFRAPTPPTDPGVAVDQFPLRVTVIVNYQGPFDTAPREMAKVVWIVP
jgi:hypothetical protein